MSKTGVIKDSLLIKHKSLQIAVGASKAFKKKGYHKTTVREIADASGLTTGNLYDYISKKSDALFLVYREFHSLWVEAFDENKILSISDPVEQLTTAFEIMCDMADKIRDMGFLMYTESKSLEKESLKEILSKEARLINYFTEILENGKKKGRFRTQNPELVGNLIVYLFNFYTLRSWNFRKKYSPSQITEFMINFILDAILTDTEVTQESGSKEG